MEGTNIESQTVGGPLLEMLSKSYPTNNRDLGKQKRKIEGLKQREEGEFPTQL